MSRQRQIYVICVSGTHEKLQMAAMVTSVGAASGDKVTAFFTMNALNYFVKNNNTKAPAEGEFGELLLNKGVPEYKQLFKLAVDLGDVELLPCSMAIDLLEITINDLDLEFGEPTGMTKVLMDADGAQILTF